MTADTDVEDAVVIGGGFYGAAIAVYLTKQRGFGRCTLVEREPKLLSRASYNNQARAHNGYHYPRSFTTAYRSRINLPKFVHDWPEAIQRDFTKLYAISRQNSKVTAQQFARFCKEIGAKIETAPRHLTALFEPRLIEAVYLAEEYAFDSRQLAIWATRELAECGATVRLNTTAESIQATDERFLRTQIKHADGTNGNIRSRYIFNCTYSGLNQLRGAFPRIQTGLKHEVSEMALIRVPEVLRDIGITVMDGPFFSMMPFPARGLHTLSHVRYTPHLNWADQHGTDPYRALADYDHQTRFDRMRRDVSRYVPAILNAEYVESLFEIKTVLVKNEGDDGRPILFEKHAHPSGCFSVLGGKIDNIYDIFEKLEAEHFDIY